MVIDLLLIAAWAAAVFLSRKLYKDVFTPLCVYVSVWLMCLLLFRLRLVNYYELETRTVGLFAASILAFVLGCLLAYRRNDIREHPPDVSKTVQQEPLERATKMLCVLNLVGVLIFAYQMNNNYGLGTYFRDPQVIRGASDVWSHAGPLGLLMMLDYPLLACAWVHYLLTKRWRGFTIFALLLVLVQTYLRTDRGSLTYYAVTCISLWIYWNRWRTLNWRMLLTLGLVSILLVTYFLGVGLLYGKLVLMQEGVWNMGDFRVTSGIALTLVNPYIYATSPIGGFQPAIADVSHFSWGTHTFYPVARVLYGLGILSERPEPYDFDFYLVPIPVNTYTHIFAFYQDFGVPGVILLPMILGYLETRLYLRMKAGPSLFLLGVASAFMALNVFSVFVPLVTGVTFWYYSAVLYAVSRFCQRRERPVRSRGVFRALPGTA
jgi:oligosaccharide repeat unit polymerase